jgi:hypothetical protein
VRDRSEIARLLGRAYLADPPLDRIMGGLGKVAAALDANDRCLAHIAAVHMRMPDLADRTARERMEAEDSLIKYARDEGGDDSWNPALHPRTGTSPNPGWFAPTNGSESESSPVRTAQNENPNQSSDVSPDTRDKWVRLPPTKRIDELGDLIEWIANAKPKDEQAIKAEIKRYFDDVGDTASGDMLRSHLAVILRPGFTREQRQQMLRLLDPYTYADPAVYVGTRELLNNAILVAAGSLTVAGAPSYVWKLGWGLRGRLINNRFGDPSFPFNYPVIDKVPNGIATSVKSVDLNATTYQQDIILENRLNRYVDDVREFDGADWGGTNIQKKNITGRAVELIVPKGSVTDELRITFARVRARAMQGDRPVEFRHIEY